MKKVNSGKASRGKRGGGPIQIRNPAAKPTNKDIRGMMFPKSEVSKMEAEAEEQEVIKL